jgi:ubiquitin-activating enzyme E1
MYSDIRLSIMAQVLGSVMAMEIVKFTGKFEPIRGSYTFDILDILGKDIDLEEKNWWRRCLGNNVMEKLNDLKLTVVGSGTSGAELMRSLVLIGVGQSKGRIDLLDMDLVNQNNCYTHFYF